MDSQSVDMLCLALVSVGLRCSTLINVGCPRLILFDFGLQTFERRCLAFLGFACHSLALPSLDEHEFAWLGLAQR